MTSFDRGSALSEPLAAVNVCLIGKSGSAVLHRIPPVNDPSDNRKLMEQVCSVSAPPAGLNPSGRWWLETRCCVTTGWCITCSWVACVSDGLQQWESGLLQATWLLCLLCTLVGSIQHSICLAVDFIMCRSALQLAGDDSGADCSSLDSVDQPQVWPAGKEPIAKPRFQVR